ncbi:MAG: nucleotide exchange factor GrpE [Verrucomicrobia bacterium]|nr:nucleotide exchange factor GrpE [Verrucomicrobiota bacterium]
MSDKNETTAEAAQPEAAPPAAESGPLTPNQIEELKAKAAKAEEHWERLLRTAAEMENLRKRAARDRQDAIRYANESLVAKLVPVLDNFDAALAAASTPQNGSGESLRVGINMIFSQLRNVLAEVGLEEVDATGATFDPNLH